MTDVKQTTDDRLAAGDRLVSLSEAAELLHMKRPNVAKYLARHNVLPAVPKASGYLWWLSEIQERADARENEPRRSADRQRSETARRRAAGEEEPEPTPDVPRLGPTQKAAMLAMVQRPVEPTEANRFALLRLAKRDLCERVLIDDLPRYQLTAEGRAVAGRLR